MARFPENDRSIFDDYLPGDLQQVLGAAMAHMVGAGVPSPEFVLTQQNFPVSDEASQRRAMAVAAARASIVDVLVRTRIIGVQPIDDTVELGKLRSMNQLVKTHDYGLVRERADAMRRHTPAIQLVDFDTMRLAFEAGDIGYDDLEFIFDRPDDPVPRAIILVGKTLPGFPPEHRPSDEQLAEAHRCLQFLMPATAERAFRLGAIAAECAVAMAGSDVAMESAVDEYAGVLGRLPADRIDDRKLVALRIAAAQLALADRGYRGRRRATGAARDALVALYRSAVEQVSKPDLAIAADNPLREVVELHAAQQEAKVLAGLNVLGYQDTQVPPNEPKLLRLWADQRIASAKAAVADYVKFKQSADALADAIDQATFDDDVAGLTAQIDEHKLSNATDKKEQANNQVKEIDLQISQHEWGAGLDLAMTIVSGGLPSLFTPGGAIGAAKGVMSYMNQRQSLELQKKNAELNAKIASREIEIVRIEQRITAARHAFLQDRIRTVRARELSPDLYYAVADTFRDLAERHLDAAIRWAYLYERAAAFSKFRTGVEVIRFDYLHRDDRHANATSTELLLTAADRLADDLGRVEALTIDRDRTVGFVNEYHLKREFPLEFEELRKPNGGKMRFTLPLTRVERDRPGHERIGIKYVGVEVFGVTAPQGWSGDLRHQGNFLVRDAATTPEPGSGHLLPSDADLAAAFARVADGEPPEPIGGVIPYWLPKSTFPLTDGMAIPTPQTLDPFPDSLTGLEGYSPDGTWELELRGPALDFTRITEVIVHISYLSPQQIPRLKEKIDQLLVEHDRTLRGDMTLDEIRAFSMRERFGVELAALARDGACTLLVHRDDFRANAVDLELKTIIARVVRIVDDEQRGVAGVQIAITRADERFERSRVTDDDGYTEPRTAPLQVLDAGDRFDVAGTYQMTVLNPASLPPAGDIQLFFYYDLREP